MKENKLVQEALIQMKQVEEAIAENAKGILASTMKEEINQLVKESLSEQDDEDEVELDADIDMSTDNDDVNMDMDIDSDDDSDDVEMDFDMDSNDTPIDLTDASDEEILKVFKAMGEDDGIIVKKDGENVHLTDNDADVEYLVKLGESEDEMMSDDEDDMMSDDEDDMMSDYEDEDDVIRIPYDMPAYKTKWRERKSDMEEGDMMSDDGEFDESVDDVIDAIFSGDMSDVDSEDMSDDEDVVYEITLDDDSEMMDEEDDMEYDDMEDLTNETYKPKGVGMGKPKFDYKKTTGGFKEDMKQGPKSVGTGKAKFDYKKGANMGGKSKVVKAETKEGQGYKDREDERLAMKYGKIASKDLKTTKARRDDAGFEKRETKEAARTYGMGSKEGRGLRKGITPNRNYVYGKGGVKTESTQEEVRMLREKNEEYRKALNVFREKLNEVATFNSNLAYATRLFTEHSTTKKEKINILRRFDDVDTLKESKNLYKSIKDELSNVDTKSITESVGAKLNKTVTTGSSTTLIESKTYENPQFLRMKDLMGKLG
jgi:hypothetical protein